MGGSARTLALAALLSLMVHHDRAGAGDLRQDLAATADASVFFGHQSVGANVLDGLRELAAAQGVPVRIELAASAFVVPSRSIGHAFVPENGDPLRKLESFRSALAPGKGAPAEIALLKFCYVDFNADTDVRALFTRYQETMRRIQAESPDTTLVHVTVPLTTLQSGPKATIKRLLGRPVGGLVENAKRDEYNAMLRAAYRGREPLFDLAEVEATDPSGRLRTSEWKGRAIPALLDEYTDDGEHLNAAGRIRAARAFVEVIAAARMQSRKRGARLPAGRAP